MSDYVQELDTFLNTQDTLIWSDMTDAIVSENFVIEWS